MRSFKKAPLIFCKKNDIIYLQRKRKGIKSMWTVEKLTAECQKLSDKFNDKFDIPVTINGRLTTTLGRCRSMRQYSEWAPVELSR